MVSDMSDSNWNRLVREIQSVVDLTVTNMNKKDLGSWTIGKDNRLDKEFIIRTEVVKALNTAIASAGTNSLTAYSKKILEDALVKIVEEQ